MTIREIHSDELNGLLDFIPIFTEIQYPKARKS